MADVSCAAARYTRARRSLFFAAFADRQIPAIISQNLDIDAHAHVCGNRNSHKLSGPPTSKHAHTFSRSDQRAHARENTHRVRGTCACRHPAHAVCVVLNTNSKVEENTNPHANGKYTLKERVCFGGLVGW